VQAEAAMAKVRGHLQTDPQLTLAWRAVESAASVPAGANKALVMRAARGGAGRDPPGRCSSERAA
jgi:hypothetical protein